MARPWSDGDKLDADDLNVATLPPGVIMAYGAAAAPTGWVLCDGASYLRTGEYAQLFAIIGTTFGSADGTHFNVPDLKGRVPVGKSTDTEFDNLAETGGEKTHQLTEAELAAHTHSIAAGSGAVGNSYLGKNSDNNSTPVSTGSAGSNTAHNNLQPYLVVNYIIKL